MSDDKSKTAATPDAAAILKENEELKAKVTALEAVTNAEAAEGKAPVRLTDKQREFSASWTETDPQSNKSAKKSGKARLKDVPKINVSGKTYSQEEFLKDADAKATALRAKHILIEILK